MSAVRNAASAAAFVDAEVEDDERVIAAVPS